MRITGIPTTPTLSNEAAHRLYGKSTLGVPVGTILMFGGTSANVPTGFLLCDGSTVLRSAYPDLFNYYNSLSPTLPYGSGNGSTTFGLPNLKSRFPIGVGTNVSTLGATGGSLNHTHTMGAHTHTQSHTHTMTHYHNMSHSHTIDHRHQIDSHTHEMDHIHWIPFHYHSVSGSTSGANHAHNVYVSGATAAGSSGVRGGTNESTTYTYATTAAQNWTYSTGGYVANTSNNNSRNGNNGFWSSGATQETTSGNPTATSYTSDFLGSTDSTVLNSAPNSFLTANSNTANTDAYTSNTGEMTTTPNTSSSNPSFLTVNFIVKT